MSGGLADGDVELRHERGCGVGEAVGERHRSAKHVSPTRMLGADAGVVRWAGGSAADAPLGQLMAAVFVGVGVRSWGPGKEFGTCLAHSRDAGQHLSCRRSRVYRVTLALAPSSPSLLSHRTIGASSGYLKDLYGRWAEILPELMAASTVAAELSALSESELPGLVAFLNESAGLPFSYVSVHAPTKSREIGESELVDVLLDLPKEIASIVVHPDVIDDPAEFARLGTRLVIENMDRRKPIGRTADELEKYFAALPDAGLCFDVPHAASVDPTLASGQRILDVHGHRLRQVHLSSLDDACHHQPLTSADELRFVELLDRCRDVPWILEAPLRER